MHVQYLKLAQTLIKVRWRYDGNTIRLRYDLSFVQMGLRILETTR